MDRQWLRRPEPAVIEFKREDGTKDQTLSKRKYDSAAAAAQHATVIEPTGNETSKQSIEPA